MASGTVDGWAVELRAVRAAPGRPTPSGDRLDLPASALDALQRRLPHWSADYGPDSSSTMHSSSSSSSSSSSPLTFAVSLATSVASDAVTVTSSPTTLPHGHAVAPPAHTVYAGVREFTADDGCVVVSQWLCEALGVPWPEVSSSMTSSTISPSTSAPHDAAAAADRQQQQPHQQPPLILRLRHVPLPKATFVQLRPIPAADGRDTGHVKDIRSLLESFMRRNFTTITQGTVLPVVTPTATFRFRVELVRPGEKEGNPYAGAMVIDTEVEVDLLPVEGTATRMAVGAALEEVDAEKVAHLAIGARMASRVHVGRFRWFRCPVDKVDVTWMRVSVHAVEDGDDVDLFISSSVEKPDNIDHDMYNVDVGHSSLLVDLSKALAQRPLNAPATPGFLYIGVYGYAKGGSNDASTNASSAYIPFELKVEPAPPVTDIKPAETAPIPAPSPEPSQPTPETVQCDNCKSWIAQRTITMHSAFCSRNNYRCEKCGVVMKREDQDKHYHCDECDWHGELAHKEKHKHYMHTLITCTCSMPLFLADMHQHRTNDCPTRLIECRYCHTIVPAGPRSMNARDLLAAGTPLTQHESDCGARTIQCAACGKSVVIKDVAVHMRLHEFERGSASTRGAGSKPPPLRVCRSVCCAGHVEGDGWATLGLCRVCFGPFYVAERDEDGRKRLTRLVHAHFEQLSKGCNMAFCRNEYCATSSRRKEDYVHKDPNELAVLAFQLASAVTADTDSPIHLCCKHSKLATIRRLADDRLVPMGYHRAWCVKALEEAAKAMRADDDTAASDDSDSENDDAAATAEKEHKYEDQWIARAIDWLLRNAPTSA